jgi:uncharacterized protein
VPVPTDDDRAFWTGGADGQLLIHRCTVCRHWFHPPAPVCPCCHTRDVQPEPVSGHGTVWAATVNHQTWFEGLPPPYVVGIIELVEQAGLRLLSNVVGCDPDAVRAGMAVRVEFERVHEDVWLPVFRAVV